MAGATDSVLAPQEGQLSLEDATSSSPRDGGEACPAHLASKVAPDEAKMRAWLWKGVFLVSTQPRAQVGSSLLRPRRYCFRLSLCYGTQESRCLLLDAQRTHNEAKIPPWSKRGMLPVPRLYLWLYECCCYTAMKHRSHRDLSLIHI